MGEREREIRVQNECAQVDRLIDVSEISLEHFERLVS